MAELSTRVPRENGKPGEEKIILKRKSWNFVSRVYGTSDIMIDTCYEINVICDPLCEKQPYSRGE